MNAGFKESLPPNVDALDLRRALSLLSNNSWGSVYEPDLIALEHPHPMHHHPDNHPTNILHHHGIQSVPLPPPDYWQADQQSIDPHSHSKTSNPANTQFQEFQLFNRFYSNPMDEI